MKCNQPQRDGYVIVAVLIVVVVLSLAAYSFTDLMSAEHTAATRTHDHTQARLSAISGVHYTAAALADPEFMYNQLGGDPTAPGAFHAEGSGIDVFTDPNNSRLNRGFFLVATVPDTPGNYLRRDGAVIDEMGKLNINYFIMLDASGDKLYDALMKLADSNPLMTPELADAIVDWVDADDETRETGAESSYYAGIEPGYMAKNGPLNSLDELLLVRGVTPELLFGNDRNRNGVADDFEGQVLDRGLSDYLTVYGRELNLDSTGVIREYINESEVENLQGLYERLQTKLDPEMADFIMAYRLMSSSRIGSSSSSGGRSRGGSSQSQSTRPATADELHSAVQAALAVSSIRMGGKRPKSVLDMMSVQITLPKPPGAMQNDPTPVYVSPLSDPARLNALLPLLLDRTTVTTKVELAPRINVNTASREVLLTIPRLEVADVDNIIAMRPNVKPGDPATTTGAWLATSGAITPDTFRRIERYVTGQSMVYRVQCVGYASKGGPQARVEAVIDTNRGAPRILYFRELTDLDNPRGFAAPAGM